MCLQYAAHIAAIYSCTQNVLYFVNNPCNICNSNSIKRKCLSVGGISSEKLKYITQNSFIMFVCHSDLVMPDRTYEFSATECIYESSSSKRVPHTVINNSSKQTSIALRSECSRVEVASDASVCYPCL